MATELYELTVQGVHAGQYVENVLHFQGDNLTANDTWTNGGDLVASFFANIMPKYLSALPPTYQCNRIAARRAVTKPSVVQHKQFGNGTQVGSLGTEASSLGLCPCVFLIPPIGIPSGGKVFMPCVPEGQIVGNSYQSGYVTILQDLFNTMQMNFGTGSITWQQAIFSRKHNTFSLAISYRFSPVIGYIGKRRKAVGG